MATHSSIRAWRILGSEDEKVGWHHRLNGHEPEQTLGDTEGLGSLAWRGPWGRRVGHH